MNTNPGAIKVLCFGDSNTHGTMPDRVSRYAADIRWTGQLQALLGDGYYIIEEGLGGRTTNLEHYNSEKGGRNGFIYFKPCIESHLPIDVLVVMLGTNDLKNIYNRSAEDVASALKEYVDYTIELTEKKSLKPPRIVLVSPIHVSEKAVNPNDLKPGLQDVYDDSSVTKSRELAMTIKKLAEEAGCLFVDASQYGEPGEDGLHLTLESNQKLAGAIAGALR